MRPGSDLIVAVIEALVLLGPLLVVPLGHRARGAPSTGFYRYAPLACGVALLFALRSRGATVAPLFALPWVVYAAVDASRAVRPALARSRWSVAELSVDLARVYLPVGAAWAFAYVAGMTVMGFAGLQCALTSAHFHYAGFGACVVAGLAGRALPSRGVLRGLSTTATVGMMSGIALLAAGIAAWRPLEFVAAWVVAGSLALQGAVMVALALRGWAKAGAVSRALAGASGLSTLVSASLAVWFSLTGFAGIGESALRTMVLAHGAVNALGFVGLGIAAFALSPPRSRAGAVIPPFSRLTGRMRSIGVRFFEREGVVDESRSSAGLMDDFGDYSHPALDPSTVNPAVREFYTDTRAWTLYVTPRWQPGFGWAGRVWKALALRMGQLNLPWDAKAIVRPVSSRLVALREDVDGRPLPRGWVRSYRRDDGGEGDPIYIAAYSSHVREGRRYMNIAFALPLGNMTSLLRMNALGRGGGISLTTLQSAGEERDGDQGVYGVGAMGVVRLPLDETIDVWATAEDEGWAERHPPPAGVDASGVELLATHDMWLLGMRYLRLTYHMKRG